MTSIVPNWTEIRGLVKSIQPHPNLTGYSRIRIEVEKKSDVKGFKNLLANQTEKQISAIVATSALTEKKIREGDKLICHLRMTQNRENFINPESLEPVA